MAYSRFCIIAAGNGSRMGEVTEHLPKSLMPVAGKAMLLRQLEVIAKVAPDSFTTIVCQPKHSDVISAFLQTNGLLARAEVVAHAGGADGSLSAIRTAIGIDGLDRLATVFLWADVLPNEAELAQACSLKQSFVSIRPRHAQRFSHNGKKVKAEWSDSSGIIGCYGLQPDLLESISHLTSYGVKALGPDLADFLAGAEAEVAGFIVNNAEDLGTLADLRAYSARHATTRTTRTAELFFSNDYVYKRPFCQMQLHREAGWYHTLTKMSVANAFIACDEQALQLHKCLTYASDAMLSSRDVNRALQWLDGLYEPLSRGIVVTKEMLELEVLHKLGDRMNDAEAMLRPQGISQDDFDVWRKLGGWAFAELCETEIGKPLVFGHGDPIVSNWAWLPSGDFTMLDPRGRFAGYALATTQAYDFGKVLFGLHNMASLADDATLAYDDVRSHMTVAEALCLRSWSKAEVAWAVVHALSAFGVFNRNPYKQKMVFDFGLQQANELFLLSASY